MQMEKPRRRRHKRRRGRRRRGVYILPNLLTTGALFFGFYAIIQASSGRFETAAIAVLIATVLDGLDGRVARLTNTSSDFGKEYDSLSDVICFGLAPTLILFDWTLHAIGKIGWLCAFLYVSATALRLARFNTQPSHDSVYFQGLPCPMAGAFLVSWMWIMETTVGREIESLTIIATLLVVLLALGMVSTVPYPSFKNFGMKGQVPFLTSVGVVFIIALISFDPPKVVFTLITAYLISGPVVWFGQVRKRRKRKRQKKQDKERTPPKEKS